MGPAAAGESREIAESAQPAQAPGPAELIQPRPAAESLETTDVAVPAEPAARAGQSAVPAGANAAAGEAAAEETAAAQTAAETVATETQVAAETETETQVAAETRAETETAIEVEAEAQPEVAEARPARPVVTVTGDAASERPMRVVERALRSQSARSDGWRDRVVVVPGGHRPGKPDQLQRDRARARLPISGPRRIVVLGCTRGAGQTTTVLLAGDMLAGLRDEPVAVLDLNPGRNSLAEQAAAIPGLVADPLDAPRLVGDGAWSQAGSGAGSGLQVISGNSVPGSGDAGRVIDAVARRYLLTLADPAAGSVPRTLEVADQLMIVAPASAEAASALGMTFEWLDAHGYGRLATSAVTVLNGVSGPTTEHAERAANVANGRCRAIVKVPWDSHLKDIARDRMPYRGAADRHRGIDGAPTVLAAPTEPSHSGRASGSRTASLLSPALTHAYTALAGVLVAGLADPGDLRSAR
jgi:MinD-like ATPase involved in chromosome partitioning or flagellar assembly